MDKDKLQYFVDAVLSQMWINGWGHKNPTPADIVASLHWSEEWAYLVCFKYPQAQMHWIDGPDWVRCVVVHNDVVYDAEHLDGVGLCKK